MAIFDIDTLKIEECSKEFGKQVDIVEESLQNIRDLLLDLKTVSSGDDFNEYLEIISQDKEFEPYANMVDSLRKLSSSFSKIDDNAKKAMKNNAL